MNTMKITFLAFLLAFSTACFAQTPNPETPNPLVNDSVALEQCTAQELEAIIGIFPWDDSDHDGIHSPTQPVIPTVINDMAGQRLIFTSVVNNPSITYFVVGADDSICQTGTFQLPAGSQESVSTVPLPNGDYILALLIGPRYYIGEFTISRE